MVASPALRLPIAAFVLAAFLCVPTLLPNGPIVNNADAAAPVQATQFGQSGSRIWSTYDLSTYAEVMGACGCEPSLGVNWLQGGGEDVLYNAGNTVICVNFDPMLIPALAPVANVKNCSTPIGSGNPVMGLPNQDPLLFTDFDGGRTWVAQLQVVIYSYAGLIPNSAPPVTPLCEPLLNSPPFPVVWGVLGTAGVAQPSCLITGCSAMVYTDYFDATNPDTDQLEWKPVADACSLPGWDHQSVGAGPWSFPAPKWAPNANICDDFQTCQEECQNANDEFRAAQQEVEDRAGVNLDPQRDLPCQPAAQRAVYYCAQAGTPVCWISYDNGVTFLPFSEDATDVSNGQCIGIHGHLRISRAYQVEDLATNDGPHKGDVFLPSKACTQTGVCDPTNCMTGFMVTTDNGLSWNTRFRPNPINLGYEGLGYPDMVDSADCDDLPPMDLKVGFFDPSIAPSLDHGWLYLGQGENDGPSAGNHAGAYVAMSKTNGVTWEDVGTGNGACPGTKYFNVGAIAGVKQAAFAEMIAGDDDRAAFAFLGSTTSDVAYGDFCSGPGSAHVWDLYIAFTYDAGKTWSIDKATKDPAQRGYIWAGGFITPPATCRNLLDFNDIVTDKFGRVIVAFSDGCKGTCITGAGSGGAAANIARQVTGRGLMAKYDIPDPLPAPLVDTESGPDSEGPKKLAPAPEGATDTGDKDEDGIYDMKDNCVSVSNIDQADTDLDGRGNACDGDDDNDGVPDGADNCPLAVNVDQRDANSDGIGDGCDNDADGDAILNALDNCWILVNAGQEDLDGDGYGDPCDADRDGDGVPNASDQYPDDGTRWGTVLTAADAPLSAERPARRVAAAEDASSSSGLMIGAGFMLLGLVALSLLLMRRRSD